MYKHTIWKSASDIEYKENWPGPNQVSRVLNHATTTRIQRNLIGSNISKPSTKFVFFGPIGKQDGRPGLWLVETFLTSPLKPLNEIQRIWINRKQDINVLYQDCVFRAFSETTEPNSKKFDGKQDLNVLYQVCVFRVDRKNKMAALASDWLRYFRLLLWNSLTECNETWQEARSQRPLPSLWIPGRSEKQDGRPGLWFA